MIGQNLGSFKIESILGSGAMGVVYRATHEQTGKPAAIKVILGDTSQKNNATERFKREAEILQQFRHPNIVRFLAVGRSSGRSYFAMEYIEGETLDRVVDRRGPLPWADVVDLGIQFCEALHYAHEHGVVHRDLKPSNLMITAKGQVKLTDFGIAKDLDATALTATGRTLGTAAYMAPEQIRGTPEISHKTDLYALGVLLYQLLVGETPFQGTTALVLMNAHMTADAPRPSARVQEIPKALDDLVMNLMAKKPVDRPWDAAAVGEILKGLRDKKAKGAPIAMVWPLDGDPRGNPTRAGSSVPARPKASRQGTKGKGAAASAEARNGFDIAELLDNPRLGVYGLIAAAVLLGAGIAYVLWPTSAAYLHSHAEALMAHSDHTDWTLALDRYIEPLDSRFPDHAYKAQTETWRDKIALNAAERRAGRLETSKGTGLAGPSTDVETLYLRTFEGVQALLQQYKEPEALAAWEKSLAAYAPHGREARGWILLTKGRIKALSEEIAKRRATAEALLAEADLSEKSLNEARAERLRRDAIETYARYPDLRDLIDRAKAALPGAAAPPGDRTAPPVEPDPAPEPSPEPAPAAEPNPAAAELATPPAGA
ncbi:serine/threonine-protein kinase [Isosphaeraceae bacterium EP7]